MANWSPDRQQAVQARCEAATKGPWHARTDAHVSAIVAKCEGVAVYGLDCLIYFMRRDYDCLPDTFERQKADALFTAHARQDLPDALETIAAKDAEIARLHEQFVASAYDAKRALDEKDALIARQQADLTRLAEVRKRVSHLMSMIMINDNADAMADWAAQAKRLLDAKEAARE